MHLNGLKTFLAIVETGSLIGAAHTLNVTQSTITARLKSLEEEIGQELIIRDRSGAALTGAGQRLIRYAQTISDLWQQAQQETSLPTALSSVCNIGCYPDLWPNLGEIFFDHIRTKLPQVALSVWLGSASELTNWLNTGLIDISLTYLPNITQKQQSISLGQDHLTLVSTNQNAPMKSDPGYIFVEGGDEFGRDHAAYYSDTNTTRISFGTGHLGLEYILKHGGSAYLAKRISRAYLAEKVLFENTTAPVFQRSIYLVANNAAISKWAWFDEAIGTILNSDAT